MGRIRLSTIVVAIAAVVISWFLVDAIFHLMWFVARLGVVAAFAVVVFLVLRMLFTRRDSTD